jgi:hypothetical protein
LKSQTFILILFLTTFGCLSTHNITHDQTGYDQMNTQLLDKKGIVTLWNEDEYVGYEITIGEDSTSGVDIERSAGRVVESNPWRIATSEIKMIEIKDHLRGGLIAFGTGFALGAIIGVLLAEPVAELNDEDVTTSDYFITAGILGLVGGVTFGLPGFIIGYKDKYILIPITSGTSDVSEHGN